MTDRRGAERITAGRILIERSIGSSTIELVIHGELDLASVPELQGELDSLAALEPEEVILDLRGVTFLDSSGVRLLLSARQAAAAQGYRLMLRNIPAQTMRILDMTGATRYFEIVG
jgi:anti-sigma B factor antagonist